MTETLTAVRPVAAVVDAVETLEGGGFLVHRPFPTAALDLLDPFLLLDEMGPADVAPGEAVGAPDHPHRGFETVTYMLEGEFEHRDSAGHHGVIHAGDVQWMTAGSGVVHSEMPGAQLQREGGRTHGLQLWVNLPRADKMTVPRYQDLRAVDIPTVERDGFSAKVIAGDALGVSGPASTHVPILYVHVRVDAGAVLELPIAHDANAFAYVLEGSGDFDGTAAGRAQMVVLGAGGDGVRIAGGPDGVELVVLAGRPLHEPVARYGPFVMNTKAELIEAFEDYQAGRMGEIGSTGR
ncbi:MAG TPA: pirin family protein [Acidimicrobiia bacterium]|nr:pirin family protein [Acidimicrobiia bacterium]